MRAIPAYAKINLSLEVLRRRPDGYHDLVSLLQTVSLADELTFEDSDRVELSFDDSGLQTEDNLVLRAAFLLRHTYGVKAGAAITLRKRTPVAAGLGGGSSDAATTLQELVSLWELPVKGEELVGLAARLGSDVPFFLTGGRALVEGRGELVTPLPDGPATWYVLAKPDGGLETKTVFESLAAESMSDGEVTRALASGRSAEGQSPFGFNGLQETAFRICPAARRCFDALQEASGRPVILSGSGPTSVAWAGANQGAEEAARSMRDRGFWSEAVRCVGREESVE